MLDFHTLHLKCSPSNTSGMAYKVVRLRQFALVVVLKIHWNVLFFQHPVQTVLVDFPHCTCLLSLMTVASLLISVYLLFTFLTFALVSAWNVFLLFFGVQECQFFAVILLNLHTYISDMYMFLTCIYFWHRYISNIYVFLTCIHFWRISISDTHIYYV